MMTNTNTNDRFMCARTGCLLLMLVGGWCSIALDGAMLFLLSFASSAPHFSELLCATFCNVEPCTHTCCVYVLYTSIHGKGPDAHHSRGY